jgi:predicted nuclease of predicted toxin-antitoxin system
VSTVRYLFDEDFNGRIIRGLRRRAPHLDTQTVQAAGLAQAPDTDVLQWAASNGRVLISHDHRTMRPCA